MVAAREEDFLEISQLCRTYGITKCTKVIRGGESRAHSVLLAALEAGEGMELLAVQDWHERAVFLDDLSCTLFICEFCAFFI